MIMLASQITSLTVVYSIVYSGVNQRKHQSSASLAFVLEIHRGPVNFPHKGPVTRKMFPFDDVIMLIVRYVVFLWIRPYLAETRNVNDHNCSVSNLWKQSFALVMDNAQCKLAIKITCFHGYDMTSLIYVVSCLKGWDLKQIWFVPLIQVFLNSMKHR